MLCSSAAPSIVQLGIYYTDIRLLARKDNPVADALSCTNGNSFTNGIDYQAMAECQKSDEEVQAFRTATTNLCLGDILCLRDGDS